jgi:hypothetical protein
MDRVGALTGSGSSPLLGIGISVVVHFDFGCYQNLLSYYSVAHLGLHFGWCLEKPVL